MAAALPCFAPAAGLKDYIIEKWPIGSLTKPLRIFFKTSILMGRFGTVLVKPIVIAEKIRYVVRCIW
jgi:hypothetical protein